MSNPWQQTIPINEALARKLIAGQFPEIKIKTFEYLGEGWDNKVYLLNGELVFRFPRREDCALECMQNEIGAMTHMAHFLPLPVSFPVYIGQACDEYPHPFAGYHYLQGQPINETGLEILPDTDFPEKFGTFLKALHAIPLESIPCTIPHEPRKMDYERCATKILEAVDFLQAKGVAVPAKPMIEQRIAGLKSVFPVKDPYCWVHGDLYSRHILMQDNTISGIIDWGDMHPNTPAVDLCALYVLLPVEHHTRFWKAYGKVSETMQQQAQMRALYISTLLSRYAYDIKDQQLLKVALQGLNFLMLLR